MISRRSIVQSSVAASLSTAFPSAFAQTTNWPEAPVKIVVPFTAGGASDALTRILAERLQARLGQNFVIDNRTGAGGNIGMQAVRSAPPDGYMIASATIGTLAINQFLFSNLGYDPVRDFEYVSLIWQNCNVFVVSAQHPAKTVQEFLAWARKQPQRCKLRFCRCWHHAAPFGRVISRAHRSCGSAYPIPRCRSVDACANGWGHRLCH